MSIQIGSRVACWLQTNVGRVRVDYSDAGRVVDITPQGVTVDTALSGMVTVQLGDIYQVGGVL